MFKRQKPHGPAQHVKELFWPSMGWRRAMKYIYLRIIRLSDSAHNIAMGLAIGGAISFSPVLGTHFIQAAAIAYVLRANMLAALIGTFVGNPWTFPLIWWAGIESGSYIFGLLGVPAADTLPPHATAEIMWNILWHDPKRLLLPWMMGGYMTGFVFAVASYFIFYRLILWGKALRHNKKGAAVKRP